jgi:3-keto-5-aminohexanoate cleavage enzyme
VSTSQSGTNTRPRPVIVAVAPNGARRGKADHPALPMTADEIAAAVAACHEAGASLVHLHVRDADGGHTLDADAYRAATDAVRATVGDRVIVQVTTEAMGRYTVAEQMAMVRAVRPEAVSLALREIVPDREHELAAANFFEWLTKARVIPQYILYSPDEVRRFADLRRRGIIPGLLPFVLFVLGRYADAQAGRPEELDAFLAALPENVEWAVCAFGPQEHACALRAAERGGHVRLGFENNLCLADGTLAADNAALVRQFASALPSLGRPLADARWARWRLAD